jgi:hypothetical protein
MARICINLAWPAFSIVNLPSLVVHQLAITMPLNNRFIFTFLPKNFLLKWNIQIRMDVDSASVIGLFPRLICFKRLKLIFR